MRPLWGNSWKRVPTPFIPLEETLFVHQDGNWNVTTVTNPAGVVQERYALDPYGQPSILAPDWTTRGNSSFTWVYLHQGGRYQFEVGLYNFRNRDLSPTLGRWLQNDPSGFGAGDVNLYRMVGNNPTGATDPSGLQANPNHERYMAQLRVANAVAEEMRNQSRRTGRDNPVYRGFWEDYWGIVDGTVDFALEPVRIITDSVRALWWLLPGEMYVPDFRSRPARRTTPNPNSIGPAIWQSEIDHAIWSAGALASYALGAWLSWRARPPGSPIPTGRLPGMPPAVGSDGGMTPFFRNIPRYPGPPSLGN